MILIVKDTKQSKVQFIIYSQPNIATYTSFSSHNDFINQ